MTFKESIKELLENPEYKDEIKWDYLCENTNLSEDFFKELLLDPVYKHKKFFLCGNNFSKYINRI